MEKRKLTDIHKKLSNLGHMMASSSLSESATKNLTLLCNYLESGDFANAKLILLELKKTEWKNGSSWLSGVCHQLVSKLVCQHVS